MLSKLRDVRRTVSHGVPYGSRKLQLGSYLAYWLDMSKSRVRPSTFRNLELNVDRLSTHLAARVPLADLAPAGIQETYRRLREQGLSAYSVRALILARSDAAVAAAATSSPRGALLS